MDGAQGGEVWWVSLDPTQGAEIQNTHSGLVLTTNVLNRLRKTVVIVPFSTAARRTSRAQGQHALWFGW
jgi:mRNA-degrading endonuclease toxin of MazEF toxin-antitoxin module